MKKTITIADTLQSIQKTNKIRYTIKIEQKTKQLALENGKQYLINILKFQIQQ